MTNSVHKDVVQKLEEVLEIVKTLPQGYQYKVRELCSCIETIVSMYDDVQKGIIPDVLVEMRKNALDELIGDEMNIDDIPEKTTLQIGDINL